MHIFEKGEGGGVTSAPCKQISLLLLLWYYQNYIISMVSYKKRIEKYKALTKSRRKDRAYRKIKHTSSCRKNTQTEVT